MPTLWVAAAVSLLLSLLSKIAADLLLSGRVPLLGEGVALHYSQNPGIAFGIVFPPLIQSGLILCAVVLVGAMAITAKRPAIGQVGYGCIIGGAFGNIVDRVTDGYVTDFVQVGGFPIFNVADSFITLGVALLLLDLLLSRRAQARP